jgi:ribulose-bisphosphate carboxylase small chain
MLWTERSDAVSTSARRLETFSYLPPLTDEQIAAQTASILERGLVPAIEHTTHPGPRNTYWSLWKLPLFDARTAEAVLAEVDACARANPDAYVRLSGYDPNRGGQVASFVVHRPA